MFAKFLTGRDRIPIPTITMTLTKKTNIVAMKIISDRKIAICLPERTGFSVQAGF
ncbi:MAG: hypothetical protein UW92_C0042G0003 [Candidatus Jorgensenbacteria bacterium GW2011_GWA2_45_13]|uniref:Uncharacterized protein n=1 Tax=Candidatus Jorgensenbacteria bacterium GW2011_GWA2_45_13 TaxID=1618662 RepID=A0A0G1L2J1_9BACT|nr:MAG: hypothetical protein UW92_C0042G0003 [Candidatus Jorgensenbacteria bacterium GW2011_GWA2_45_13]